MCVLALFVIHRLQASATRDLVQKKLVYLYLCNYAESNSDLALLTVNTLQKDCRDTNPVIRGLALRSMCNLRVPNLVEYLITPLRNGLSDSSAYVRKTAILGCVKLYYLDAAAVDDNGIADALYSMLSDRDPQVAANAVIALEEVQNQRSLLCVCVWMCVFVCVDVCVWMCAHWCIQSLCVLWFAFLHHLHPTTT